MGSAEYPEKGKEIVYSPNKYRETEGIKVANDETAFCCAVLDKQNRRVYVFAELYRKHMSNRQIYEAIDEMGFSQEQIIADCAM